MLLKLFLCFTLIPVFELYLLIKVGAVIGGFNTILLVILTGFLGAWLARLEGMNTMFKLRTNLQQGLMKTQYLKKFLTILLKPLFRLHLEITHSHGNSPVIKIQSLFFWKKKLIIHFSM